LGMLSDGQQTTALDSGLAISASSKGKEALQWQMKAEPLSSKGLITLEYLRFWYKKAVDFYVAKPWEHCTEQCVFEVEVHGIGKRNVIISGSHGRQIAVRVFNAYKPCDISATAKKQEAVIFTQVCNCPFEDLNVIAKYRLETAGPFAYPLLFNGYDTFKRPPIAELEVYRACFEVLSKFLWKRQLDHTNMTGGEAEYIRESFDIPVLDVDGRPAHHPLRAEVLFPAPLYRGEDAAPLPAPVPDPEVVSAALGADLKAAYDGVLAEFKKSGNSEASRALLKPALEMNSRPALYLAEHRLLPAYSKWGAQPVPAASDTAKVDTRSAVAYCIQRAGEWRKTKGAVVWIEEQLATLHPLPQLLPKNLTPGYAEKVKAEKFRKKMDLWVEGKMKEWDEDASLREDKKGQHPTREAYLKAMNDKADASFKKQTGQ